eukprot:scaffold90839_cov45-Attheya_sp.AAC.1
MINIACDHGASESALCELSYNDDQHLSQIANTRSTTSKQFTSHLGTSDNAEMCAFEGRVESDIDSLSNQDSENLPMNNVFSELHCEGELEYKEVAQNSTAHARVAIPLVLNTNQKRKYPSWDERFKELVDFKKVNGHTNVPQGSGPLGNWVCHQRCQYRMLKEEHASPLTNDRCQKLESIGFQFKLHASWDERFKGLVDFKKIKGHTNVPRGSGPLGNWVCHQRCQYRMLKEEKASPLTNDRCQKLESIGFQFKLHPHWDVRFQELVDFKKIKGHTNVPRGSGPLGIWVETQRTQYRILKEEKASPLTNVRIQKLESIGFQFILYPHWDVRFQELVDFKKIKGHTNVPQRSGPLLNWVKTQRSQYRLLKEGKDSSLTIDRCEKLESIGFQFKLHPHWDQQFQELVDFKKTNGHTNVPQKSGPLQKWVYHQRTQYSLLKEGKHSTLTIERSAKLESVGVSIRTNKNHELSID